MRIANQNIGKEHNPFIIAEVGINHNGSLDLAKETILLAHQAMIFLMVRALMILLMVEMVLIRR